MRIYLRIILLTLLSIVVPVLQGAARPPSEVIVEKNAEVGGLHIEVKHVSRNIRKHFIRHMYVYINDSEIKSFSYPAQKSPPGFSEDIQVETQSGDVVRVETVCNESGKDTYTVTLP